MSSLVPMTLGPPAARQTGSRTAAPAVVALALAVALAVGPAPLQAATGAQGAPAPVVASRLLPGERIVVDAIADEDGWSRALPVTDFVGVSPTEGFDPAGDTTVRVLCDDARIYFFVEARFDEPTRVRAHLSGRDDVNPDDQVGILLDPFGDGRRAYWFWLNAMGVQQDLVVTQQGYRNQAWDTLFRSEVRIVPGGFDVELAIPFRSLRFDRRGRAPWRILLQRKFAARDEYVAYPPLHKDLGPDLLQYTELLGVSPGRSGAGLEFQPTVVVRAGQDRETASGDLRWRRPGFPETVDPGLAIKWQITPSLVLDAAINPDFSQVEADPDRVDNNLRFALSLPEQRPFFLEGSELYSGFLLYSRSIVDPLFGVKVSGKEGRVSVAMLSALDQAPAASVVGERVTPGFSAQDVQDAVSLVTHAEVRVDVAARSALEVAWSDKEILRDGALVGDHHALDLTGRIALDPTSQIDAAIAWSETGRASGERLRGPSGYVEYSRFRRLGSTGGGAWGNGPGFRAENGFVTRTGRGGAYAWADHRFEFQGPFRYLAVGGSAWHAWAEAEPGSVVPDSSNQQAWAALRGPAQTDLLLSAHRWDQLYAGRDFEGGWLSASLTGAGLHWLSATIGTGAGDAVRYSDATRTVQAGAWGSLEVRALRRLRVSLGGSVDRLGRRGERIDRTWIWRTRWLLGITRALAVRAVVQGKVAQVAGPDGRIQQGASSLDLSALLTFSPSPGTSVDLGFGQHWTWPRKERPATERLDLFLKAAVVIRL